MKKSKSEMKNINEALSKKDSWVVRENLHWRKFLNIEDERTGRSIAFCQSEDEARLIVEVVNQFFDKTVDIKKGE